MAQNKSAKQTVKNSSGNTVAGAVFTAEERAAMRERSQELKKSSRPPSREKEENGESEVLGKIAAMAPSDRAIAERIHAIVKAHAPMLTSRLWYGMPAYALDGKVVCFFQDARKFKTRYATMGFSDKARLDDGQMWPTSFALKELTAADEARIAALVKRAVS